MYISNKTGNSIFIKRNHHVVVKIKEHTLDQHEQNLKTVTVTSKKKKKAFHFKNLTKTLGKYILISYKIII